MEIWRGGVPRWRIARRGAAPCRAPDSVMDGEQRMATVMVKSGGSSGPGRSRAQDIDRHVGARMRERRIMLGLTQQQMAELIGVTYQQAHKYEKGINRVAAGRLCGIAGALGVEVGYFYEGVESGGDFVPSPSQRMLLDLARNFLN